MLTLAREIPFRDTEAAGPALARIAAEIPEAPLQRLGLLLKSCADPDAALRYLVLLRERRPDAFRRLVLAPLYLQYLIAVFSTSRFLSEAILEHPEWIEQLSHEGDLYRVRTSRQMRRQLEEWLEEDGGRQDEALLVARFRRRQILRIAIRDLLGYGTLAEITEELSHLADAILEATQRRVRAALESRYGTPRWRTRSGELLRCGFSIIALGKLGGSELNYSSDIDLMFVHSGEGQTSGPERISNREFFAKAANQLTALLSAHTTEGKCYRVDLRLRPEGRLGEVSISVEAAKKYYQTRARDWELQMLIKARVCAGDLEPGREILEFVQPLIYTSTLNFSAVESVSETRQRISEKVAAKRRRPGLDIKLAPGGIRDIEFLVQCLQRLHGGRELWLQHPGTLLALRRLHDKELLSDSEYSRLAAAYTFLRHLEHRLQLYDDQQTHTLPDSEPELERLARSMPRKPGEEPSAETLRRQLEQHLRTTQEIYARVIHSQQPVYYGPSPETPIEAPQPAEAAEPDYLEPAKTNLVRLLDEKAPGLAAALARSRLKRGAKAFEHFLEHVIHRPDWLQELDADQVLAGYLFDLFEESSHFGDVLVRKPELFEEIRQMRAEPGVYRVPEEAFAGVEDANELRRLFQRHMLRIQAESICLPAPIFDTLKLTSELADATLRAAYRMAVRDVLASSTPERPGYEPDNKMVVIALGRLGMLEFDIASDADLVFVVPDEDAGEIAFWTRVAERLIQQVTAYTGEGVIFAIDTRLRPNGREGMLVQTEQSFRDYFTDKAQAWEGIAYMKSRAVAGDLERGTSFLSELQDIDWRRYGQTARSKKQLWEMRMRLEKEQGESNPLKAGRGGYYDIDFCLMYLRLKAAGMFFRVLNTPARIDILERMGHLDRADAAFLRDAATFYRAVDHALRVYSGHSGGRLPRTRYKLEAVHRLISRWTPPHLHDQPPDVELAQIQARTREFFERLFG